MKHRRAVAFSLAAWIGGAVIAGPTAPAIAGAIEPHIAGARASLNEARRHLEALPRSDKRDHLIVRVQDALKGVDDLGR
jgi:hypothetical protein